MLNRVNIMGRIVRDVELKSTRNGLPVAYFTIACERDFATSGEKQVDFIDCVAWRHTAEYVSKYFQKGSMAVISGRIEISQYTDREGNNRKNTVINVENIYPAGSKNNERSGNVENRPMNKTEKAKAVSTPSSFEEMAGDDSDLPF